MKKTVPVKLEKALYEKAKWYRLKERINMPELVHFYIHKHDIVSVPVERIVMKRYKMNEFKKAFSFKNTTLQIEEDELERLLTLYPAIPLNRIVEALLLDFVRQHEPNWTNTYFDDELFFEQYGFSEEDFLNAYQRLILEFPNLKQREYEKNRAVHEPNLYAIRKKYEKFSVFKESMEVLLQKS
ncbi:hypothetical protein [Peribacillus asahii]|uniref:hypothetical protein n=1 Tax=Peribacillus asahii TaxID=228899 RepID=UPI00207A90AF|nr:hypothetical protein [Peribacillus asahii]USK62177.1 hypothetical protein LIT37_23660 [Peribacillus asahii]